MTRGAVLQHYTVQVTGRRWLTGHTFEIRFGKPPGFEFLPGQKIGFVDPAARRDYTLLGPTHAPELALCVRHIPQGRFSPRLAEAQPGDRFQITKSFGYFTYKPSPRPAVFVATGTGVAPFVAFARAGIQGFELLHGVRSADELYYRQELASAARRYRPCLSGPLPAAEGLEAFAGRVDACLADRFPPAKYDFYLCGNGDMIRDVMRRVDERFHGSHVFTETFF